MKNILFTNDDGFESVAVHDFYHYVVALYAQAKCIMMVPDANRSGVSHAITIENNIPIREIESNKYSVEGYPADCVMLGVKMFETPDIVFSGPNLGSNLGQDILYSGTIGAAREAALHNIPALAFSFSDDVNSLEHFDYTLWHQFLDKWLPALVSLALNNRGSIVNVNISNPVSLDLQEGHFGYRNYYNYQNFEKRKDDTGEYYMAIKKEGLDVSKKVLEESDVSHIQKGVNAFTVFSAWPELKAHKKGELVSYFNDASSNNNIEI